MSKKPLIVLVEDDAVIAELIEYNLTSEGFEVKSFRNGLSMLGALPDIDGVCLFVLDLMLPGMDGFEICRSIKESGKYPLVPIIMLTARGTESDKVKGLEAGADDYITKPFGIRELLARIHAHVRRYNTSVSLQGIGGDLPVSEDSVSAQVSPVNSAESALRVSAQSGKLEFAGILLDDVRHRVYSKGKEIEITNREYELLKFLMQNRGVAYSRDDLLNYVWGYEYSGETRTVDVHIRQLRRKIEIDDSNPVIIETVRGRGYRFCEEQDMTKG
jgi:two-component system alkaline phosphatase synthesis response regulator PhoP